MKAAQPRLEILPVHLDAGAIHRLVPHARASWQVRSASSEEPGHQVARTLAGAGLRTRIVHSTSWRYDRGVVLTYVAVIETPQTEPSGLRDHPVERHDLARGSATRPPTEIAVGQVIEHGLRHLSWLASDDPEVRAKLDPVWLDKVAAYHPAPFLGLERV